MVPGAVLGLVFPTDVAVDASGNVLRRGFVEPYGSQSLHQAGVVTTLAGAPWGSTASATEWEARFGLNFPVGITIGANGHVYGCGPGKQPDSEPNPVACSACLAQ